MKTIVDILKPGLGPWTVEAFDCEAEIKGRNGDTYLSIVVCGGEDHRLEVARCTEAAAELGRVVVLSCTPGGPQGIRQALAAARQVPAGHPLAGSPEGGRDRALFHYLRLLHGRGLTIEEARLLAQVFATNCTPPLPAEHVEAKLQRAWAPSDRRAA